MKALIATWSVLAGSALLFTGCIHHHETVYRDVKRTRVAFENDRAARIFYETYERMPHEKGGTESQTEIKVPLVFKDERKVVSGPNTSFNKAVDQCDTDSDGQITEREAEHFARRH